MKIALVQYELYLNSYARKHVAGEDIDAKGMKKAFLRRPGVTCCDILSMNIICDREERGELCEYDLAIHFNHPTKMLKGAVNILFFQQYYEWDSIDFNELISLYDYVITPAKAIADEYKVLYFPLAVDTDIYQRVPLDPRFQCDISFVGNRRMRDKETYDRYLGPALKYACSIYGNGWDIEGYEDYRPYWKGVLGYDEAPVLYSSSKMSMCIHSRMYTDRFHLVTTRGLHSLGCNCMVLSDKIDALREMLPEGTGIIYTDGNQESEHLLKKYLNDDDARLSIAEKGRNWVLNNHTWDIRIEQLMQMIKE